MWALYMDLANYTSDPVFEDEAWEILVDECVKTGIDTIVLGLANEVKYTSHPELSGKKALPRARIRREVKRLRELGVSLIPGLNFSACHQNWLGDYRKMMGLPEYYRVCREIIYDVCELFDNPQYVHLGMDEEAEPLFYNNFEMVSYRRKELIWHDLQFFCDCVADKGVTPWIWADLRIDNPEEFRAHISTENILLSPWNYRGLKKEHYTPVSSNPKYVEKYSKEPYKHLNMQYVEEDPLCVRFMNEAVPTAMDGYEIVPCASICFGCEYNPDDIVEYFTQNAPKDKLKGFMIAPWRRITLKDMDNVIRNLTLFREARDKYAN